MTGSVTNELSEPRAVEDSGPSSDDAYNLQRFLTVQETVYFAAVTELSTGQKRGDWMAFIFPQLRGLGRSITAQFYGITGFPEAVAYLDHPVLAGRLSVCTQLVLQSTATSVREFFGKPDDQRFRSSMTLFAVASLTPSSPFHDALRWAGGPDRSTLDLLKGGQSWV